MRDQGGISGRRAVDEVVPELRTAHACGLIREADFGHVAPTILDVAGEFDARWIVLAHSEARWPQGHSGNEADAGHRDEQA
jgi:hypothetical protein